MFSTVACSSGLLVPRSLVLELLCSCTGHSSCMLLGLRGHHISWEEVPFGHLVSNVPALVPGLLQELAWYNVCQAPVSLAGPYFFSLRALDLQDLLLRGHVTLSTCTDRSEKDSMTRRSRVVEGDQGDLLFIILSPESESVVRS